MPVYTAPGENTMFSFDSLKTPKCPQFVDPTKKEQYLSSAEFVTVFGKSREVFNKAPAWKRSREKQAVGIF
jgi:hypothetical protein